MTIRKLTFLNITLVFTIIVVVLILVSRYVFLENLKRVEDTLIRQDVERVENVFDHTVAGLELTTSDWSSWDDTYDFIVDTNEDYIDNNLVDETLDTLSLNFMLFYNSEGNLVLEKAYDLENSEETDMPPELTAFLAENDSIIRRTTEYGGIGGLLSVPDSAPLLFDAEPILTSEDGGPSRGTLIFARYFDSEEIAYLSNLAFLPVNTYNPLDEGLPQKIKDIYNTQLNDDPIQVRILSGDRIAGYTLLYDVFDNPAILIEIEQPRSVYMEGQRGILYLVLSLVATGLVLGGFAIYISNKQGLSRLVKLSQEAQEIGDSGDVSLRIPDKGTDEIGRLATSINNMLEALQQNMAQEMKLRENLETEMKNRIDFTRALVHELKTPLTPMLSSSDILVSELDTEPLHSVARNINRGAERLNRRINELLDLAKGELGTLTLSLRPIDFSSLVQEVVSETEPRAKGLGLSLTADIQKALPRVYGDDDRLRQVMLNLLDNACKYTPEGGKICIQVSETDNLITVEIRDTGPGIADEELDKVFQFYYKGTIDDKQLRGLGLGLALCKMLVELHGGKINVRNREGGGSVFSFTVPVYTEVPQTEA